MPEIIWKEPKNANSSRARRRKRRKEERELSAADASLERKIPSLLAGCSTTTLKAITLPALDRESEVEKHHKDDALNHSVNHAHQRDRRKKWS